MVDANKTAQAPTTSEPISSEPSTLSSPSDGAGSGAGEAPQSTESRGSPSAASAASAQSSHFTSSAPLSFRFPVNAVVELKLSPLGDVIRGVVYCTDEVSNSVAIKRSVVHTTLSSEITVVNAACVVEMKTVDLGLGQQKGSSGDEGEDADGDALRALHGVTNLKDLAVPLPHVSRKALDERERRALKIAEESFSHINQKASPEGQKIFDKLLKACNEVVWREQSILVLNQIRVDPPYAIENCTLLGSSGGNKGLNEGSLDRVKKIVAAAAL